MGAWTAFWAQAGGAGPDEDWGGGRSVTLLDAWGAGHLRATSSDEHRIIRSAHGTDRFYARWARRALRHWERFADEWNVPLVHRSGVLWFAGAAAGWEADSEATLRSLGIPVERLDPAAITARWPVIDPAGAAFGLFEPEAGFLMARRGVAATVAAFQRAGRRLRAGSRATWAGPTAAASWMWSTRRAGAGARARSCSRPVPGSRSSFPRPSATS